jgi:predicted glycoside hydrolase/deacetylase ChbG (UPF0249 family)
MKTLIYVNDCNTIAPIFTMSNLSTVEMLGFPAGSRLLILNIDDFGMCFSGNLSAVETFDRGTASSCTVMIPPAWGKHGCSLLQRRPEIPHGVHLTTISEHEIYRWRPLTSPHRIPSLVDGEGFFPLESEKSSLIARADLGELEIEWRAQIEKAYERGLQPAQLDSHCNIHDARDDIFALTVRLAREYGLALRVHQPQYFGMLKKQDLPAIDHPDLDSFDLPTRNKSARYVQMLRDLPPGLSEWAIHPARGTQELRTINPRWRVRAADYHFFNSADCRRVIAEEGIQVVSYCLLQPYWKK